MGHHAIERRMFALQFAMIVGQPRQLLFNQGEGRFWRASKRIRSVIR
jgi:hypothetical protein